MIALIHNCRSKNENITDLFDKERGRPIFRSIMSKKTFRYVNSALRFDDVFSRRQQKSTDKFAPIRELFEKWSDLLPDYFNPHECVTIDEQLLGFHGRCQFRQYMPSKPERYGLKFWLAVCARTSYVWKIQPYLGKIPGASAPEQRQGERVVLDLVEGLKGHNITMDNFFSSYELGQKLLSKHLTMVGTMRQNKRSIPPKLRECKKQPLFQSTFAFTKDTALVSYIARKNKCVILQSTMHSTDDVKSGEKKLPEIIEYYNQTKGLQAMHFFHNDSIGNCAVFTIQSIIFFFLNLQAVLIRWTKCFRAIAARGKITGGPWLYFPTLLTFQHLMHSLFSMKCAQIGEPTIQNPSGGIFYMNLVCL